MKFPPVSEKTLLIFSVVMLLGFGGMVGLAILVVSVIAPPSPTALPTIPPTLTPLPPTITQLPDLTPTLTQLPSTATPELTCPYQAKIMFDQSTGCQNDGSFEFCLPAYDPNAMQAVLRLAPGTSCGPGRGRAGCNENQLLCRVPTTGLCSPPNSRAAMSDFGWNLVCSLAGLEFIEAIVPTWYE